MWFRRLSTALITGFLIIGTSSGVAPSPGWAAEEVFTVRDIAVDVTAATATAAREAALADGHVRAMQKLLTRLLPREELARIRPLKADQIVEFVTDFEVADERTSNVRYLAKLTFRFKPDSVRTLLRANDLVYAEAPGKPVLVLPVFGPAGEARLWRGTNPWRQIWSSRRPADGLVPLVVPLGDLADVASIDAEQTLAGEGERLSRLARRYGADDILISQAVLLDDRETGRARLQIGTSRLGSEAHQTRVDDYWQEPGETLEALWKRAADDIDQRVQESWKQGHLFRPGAQRRMTVTVPVRKLGDWLEVKRRLKTITFVERSEISSLSRDKTEIEIVFVGDEEQLAAALARRQLTLSLDPVSGWQLRLSGGPAVPGGDAKASGTSAP